MMHSGGASLAGKHDVEARLHATGISLDPSSLVGAHSRPRTMLATTPYERVVPALEKEGLE